MEKSDRVMSEDYVAGFVPCHLLPHKRPCSLDPFLDPLITEIEDIFINGKCNIVNLLYYKFINPRRMREGYGTCSVINPRPEGYGSRFVVHSFCHLELRSLLRHN